VHGLERAWQDRIQFIHVNFRTVLGKELGRRYDVDHLPALVLVDKAGQVRKKLGMGLHLREDAEREFSALTART
jgi:hypothetical protein